jgi:hypothetical protein
VILLLERVKDRRDGSPLVQLSLFRERAFSVGMAIAVTFFLGIASFALILTLFLQIGLGFEPLHAGLTFLPFSGGVLVASGAAALSGRRRDPARGPVKPGFLVSRGVFSGGVPGRRHTSTGDLLLAVARYVRVTTRTSAALR